MEANGLLGIGADRGVGRARVLRRHLLLEQRLRPDAGDGARVLDLTRLGTENAHGALSEGHVVQRQLALLCQQVAGKALLILAF